jgi:amino acid permease
MSCCAFLIIVGDSFHRQFANLLGIDDSLAWLSRPLATLFFSLPGFGLCFYPRMAQLSKFMGFGVAVVTVIAAFIVFDSLFGGVIAEDIEALPARWDTSFSKMSVFAFALQCHIAAPRILFELSPDLSEKRTTISLLAYSYIVLLYMLVGYCGYRKFGAGVAGNVMLNFQGGWVFMTLNALNGLQAVFGYALNAYMARAAMYSLLVRMGIVGAPRSTEEPMMGSSSEIPQPHRHRLTVCMYLVTLTVACICNDLGHFATIVGASVGTLVIFVFPALLCWKLDGNSPFGRLQAAFYGLAGGFILVSGLLSIFI